MATYSINQVPQIYVASAYKADPGVVATDPVGTIGVTLVDQDNAAANPYIYFTYMGAGGQLRSDIVHLKNLLYAKATASADLARGLRRTLIELDPDLNGGQPVPGLDYILRIQISQYVGMSDEDQYWKWGLIRAYQGMTASQFYVAMAINLALNLAREIEPLLQVYLYDGTTYTAVTNQSVPADFAGTYTGIVVEELPQLWRRGIMASEPVYYTPTTVTIRFGGDDLPWGQITEEAPTTFVNNGTTAADYEYFVAGFKGDYYRNADWPYNIDTTYLIDPSLQYSVVNLHYAYVGPNESVQKSEKDIILYIPSGSGISGTTPDYTVANQIIAAINTAIASTDIVLDTLA